MKIPDHWSFDSENVASGFDAHVREQLPWYELATSTVAHIVRHYLPAGGHVVDLGASTGNVSTAIAHTLEARDATITSVEKSPHMADQWRGVGELVVADVFNYQIPPADVVVCFLLLMFLGIEERADLVERAVEALRPGGVLIIVDKREGVGGFAGTVLSRLALAHKLGAGVEPALILQKEIALAGSQRPLSPAEIPVGAVEFLRVGDFSGWLLERR